MSLAADLVLVLHFALAAFVAGGLAAIWIGGPPGWAWVRRRLWRALHLGAVMVVAAEALLGITCPLTLWEDLLRGRTPEAAGFVARWVGRLLYWDLPPAAFTLLYLAIALATAAGWKRFPPRGK